MTGNELIGYIVALVGGWIAGRLLAKWKLARKRRKWLEGGTTFTDPRTGASITTYNDDGP